MKKTVSVVLLLVMAISIFTSCANSDSANGVPDGYQLISGNGLDYQFYVPQSWKADQTNGVSAAYVSDSDRSNVSFMEFDISDAKIQFSEGGKNDEKLNAVWNYYDDLFNKTFADMKYETKGENTLMGGVAAKKYVYTATVTDIKLKYMQVMAVKEGTVYLMTYTASEGNYDAHIEEVTGILKNIVI